GFLPEIESLEYRRNLLRYVVDGKRPAVDEENDRRLAGLEHRFYEIVLPAHQLEAIPVAQVIVGPCFFVSVLIPADNYNRHVGFTRGLDSLGDQPPVLFSGAEGGLVAPPVAALFGDLAALREINFDPGANLVANSVEYADSAPRVVAIASQVGPVCV